MMHMLLSHDHPKVSYGRDLEAECIWLTQKPLKAITSWVPRDGSLAGLVGAPGPC
jgi:hypothetical protein